MVSFLRTDRRGFRRALGCHRLCTITAGSIADSSRVPLPATQTTINCTLTIEEVSERECRQTLEGDVHIGVMGLGSIAERIICSSLRDVYSGIPEIAKRRAKSALHSMGPLASDTYQPCGLAGLRRS